MRERNYSSDYKNNKITKVREGVSERCKILWNEESESLKRILYFICSLPAVHHYALFFLFPSSKTKHSKKLAVFFQKS